MEGPSLASRLDRVTSTAQAHERRVVPRAYPWIARICGAVSATGAVVTILGGWTQGSDPVAVAGLALAGGALLTVGWAGEPVAHPSGLVARLLAAAALLAGVWSTATSISPLSIVVLLS